VLVKAYPNFVEFPVKCQFPAMFAGVLPVVFEFPPPPHAERKTNERSVAFARVCFKVWIPFDSLLQIPWAQDAPQPRYNLLQ
jgi:hypothetical protein